MKRHASLLIVALLLCSCATVDTVRSDPRAELVAAQTTFAATVNQLAALREQGAFDVATADRMTLVIAEGRKYLEEWEVAVRAGQAAQGAAQRLAVILTALNKYQEVK